MGQNVDLFEAAREFQAGGEYKNVHFDVVNLKPLWPPTQITIHFTNIKQTQAKKDLRVHNISVVINFV